jgi:ribonuclease Z
MLLTLLGTGCPSVDYKRFGPANLVSSKKSNLLIDCGSGVTQRLKQADVSTASIDALILTHLHSDHIVDFYQLIISSWHSYRVKPWKIYGPQGTKKFLNKIMSAFKEERNLRISFESRSSSEAFKLDIVEFKDFGKIRIKDIMFEYFRVDHRPVKHAYGFNFYNNKKKLTISGDTRPCENLMKYAQNCDVLLHEVFIEGEIKKVNRMRTRKTLHNVKSYHTTSSMVGKVASLTRCKKLVLTHFVPTEFNEKKLKLLVKKDYGKNPIVGRDLLKIII